jgi:hypothetical protein
MKIRKSRPKDLSRNVQFENAFNWLRAMKVIKNAKDLAQIMGTSEGTVSAYLNMVRPVSPAFVYTFEEKVLLKQKPPCRLKDFELAVMVAHTRQLQKKDTMNMLELLTTQTTWIEAGIRTILEKLDKLETQNKKLYKIIGELRNTKKINP